MNRELANTYIEKWKKTASDSSRVKSTEVLKANWGKLAQLRDEKEKKKKVDWLPWLAGASALAGLGGLGAYGHSKGWFNPKATTSKPEPYQSQRTRAFEQQANKAGTPDSDGSITGGNLALNALKLPLNALYFEPVSYLNPNLSLGKTTQALKNYYLSGNHTPEGIMRSISEEPWGALNAGASISEDNFRSALKALLKLGPSRKGVFRASKYYDALGQGFTPQEAAAYGNISSGQPSRSDRRDVELLRKAKHRRQVAELARSIGKIN